MDFATFFHALTGHPPLPWQRALYGRFVERRFPSACDLPTGLGKTSTIAIWLLALAERARRGAFKGYPRRLVYVVNRRTVVDQATDVVERMRRCLRLDPVLTPVRGHLESLAAARPAGPPEAPGIAVSGEPPVALSTLRGQLADNAEWRADPARPAVVIGTVDMIGSRLLFGGYGCGFKMRPVHAALLGQDAVLIHDEAHLEPAFQHLLESIEREQGEDFRPLHVVALTATPRTGGRDVFTLTDADGEHEVVKDRIYARKALAVHTVADDDALVAGVTQAALDFSESGQAIVVFLDRLDHVEGVAKGLQANGGQVSKLTGTQRGFERDGLVRNPMFARFRPHVPLEGVVPAKGTVYLVCTAAGEVGVDMSADHVVCDLVPFDRMAQRLGRVNRFGGGDARVEVFALEDAAAPEGPDMRGLDRARARTFALLQQLPELPPRVGNVEGPRPRRDASPYALGTLERPERVRAFTPAPTILPADGALFDAWALTTVREALPGRPDVDDYLHGVQPDAREAQVAWRADVTDLSRFPALGPAGGSVASEARRKHESLFEDLLEEFPLKPHELLRGRSDRVGKALGKIARRVGDRLAWWIGRRGDVQVLPLEELAEQDDLSGTTILLPPEAGGLDAEGYLDGDKPHDPERPYDVAAEVAIDGNASHGRLRTRVWDDDREGTKGMRRVRTIDTRPDMDEGGEADGTAAATGTSTSEAEAPPRRFRHWFVRPRFADDDGSKAGAREAVPLSTHLDDTAALARGLADRLGLESREATALETAARFHDLGKARAVWQRSIGNRDLARPLAKSGPDARGRALDLSGYRHELGSLLDMMGRSEPVALDEESRDLVLHLVAAHHGRGRPHFPPEEAFDPERKAGEVAAIVKEVHRRFDHLQRRYGRWGLAYLESLLRAADALASQGAIPTNVAPREGMA